SQTMPASHKSHCSNICPPGPWSCSVDFGWIVLAPGEHFDISSFRSAPVAVANHSSEVLARESSSSFSDSCMAQQAAAYTTFLDNNLMPSSPCSACNIYPETASRFVCRNSGE